MVQGATKVETSARRRKSHSYGDGAESKYQASQFAPLIKKSADQERRYDR
jgi:hypothetical protein